MRNGSGDLTTPLTSRHSSSSFAALSSKLDSITTEGNVLGAFCHCDGLFVHETCLIISLNFSALFITQDGLSSF